MVRVSAVALAVVSALIFGNEPSLVAGDCLVANACHSSYRRVGGLIRAARHELRAAEERLRRISRCTFGTTDEVDGYWETSEEVIEVETVKFTCPSGYTRAPDAEKCFKVVTERLNFDAGQARCRQDNAHLAFIESKAQSELAKQLIRSQPIQVKSDEGYWTGGRRRVSDSCGGFTWRDANGEQHPLTYTNWHKGEPNNCAPTNKRSASSCGMTKTLTSTTPTATKHTPSSVSTRRRPTQRPQMINIKMFCKYCIDIFKKSTYFSCYNFKMWESYSEKSTMKSLKRFK